MEFTYSLSDDGQFIRVRTQGIFDLLKAYEMWTAIIATCTKSNCFKVLGESNLTAPIPTIDAYEHLSIIQAVGVTPDYRIAWVSQDESVLERLRLIETVLRSRSLFNVTIFDNMKKAKRWLTEIN